MPASSTSVAAAVAAATPREVRLPVFCADDATTWFERAEVQFRMKKVTDQAAKADYVLAALPDHVFPLVSKWLAKQKDNEITYAAIKKKLLTQFVATPEERADRLLTLAKQPLGDQRPSMALQEMIAISTIPTDDEQTKQLPLLTVLWLLRLPDPVRHGITNFTEKSDDEIGALADSLHGASRQQTARQVFAIENSESDEELSETTAAVSARRQQKTYQRPQERKKKQSTLSEICFYHKRFGIEARKCKSPCSWTKNL